MEVEIHGREPSSGQDLGRASRCFEHDSPLPQGCEARLSLRISDNSVSVYNHTALDNYTQGGTDLIILLVGGDKASQHRDIERAVELASNL